MFDALKIRARTAVLRGSATALNTLYQGMSGLRAGAVKDLAKTRPELYVKPSEAIASEAIDNLVDFLQLTIRAITGETRPYEEVEIIIREGIEVGIFEDFGKVMYVKKSRVPDLLKNLKIDEKKQDAFIEAGTEHTIFKESVFEGQRVARAQIKTRKVGKDRYKERDYIFPSREGLFNHMKRITHAEKVQAGDNRPDKLYLPGTACLPDFYDLNDEKSLALEEAKASSWVYLLNSCGLGNKTERDRGSTVDTEISNLLPAAIDFLRAVSKGKQIILIGHSKGGFNALYMLVRQAYKLNNIINKISRGLNVEPYSVEGKTRKEIREQLDQYEQIITAQGNGHTFRACLEEAKEYLQRLDSVKGVQALGSPLAFDKNSHPIFPIFLNLNIILPLLMQDEVPVDLGKRLARMFPWAAKGARMLINPANFDDPDAFLRELAEKGTDSFPLGVGFQMLKAIYSGQGLRRMTKDKFEYPKYLHLIPIDIPIFMLYGDMDILAPTFNLGFIDPKYAEGSKIDLNRFSTFRHKKKLVYEVASLEDVMGLDLKPRESQVIGIKIANINHLDFFYGKTGMRVVRPLMRRINEVIWTSAA